MKLTGLAGTGLLTGLTSSASASSSNSHRPYSPGAARFNMSGYAAPKLETVRVAVIGLGNRGSGAVRRLSKIGNLEIKALCDVRREKAEAAKKSIENTAQKPELYTAGENDWKKICERKDIDLIYITTPWHLHTPMAVYAMEHEKHAASEVPVAVTLEECWQLVETSEKTRRHCMILENCCYDFFELLTLNMARQGYFGEIMHGEGAYIHDLLQANFKKESYYDMWRLKENLHNGNLYPTHGLGPIAQVLDINRGDRMDYLVSMSNNDFMMAPLAKELAAKDDFYKPYASKTFRGNMNTTTIRTVKGKTIMIQHDVSSPRPYSRLHTFSGTKGVAQKYPEPARIANSHERWLTAEELKEVEQKYQPPIVKKVGELAKQVGGHGGMDFLMDWRMIDCLRNGLPLDLDVYDAALWSSITHLSQKSLSNRSNSIDVPDFTRGSWKTNAPVDISLAKGGDTKVVL